MKLLAGLLLTVCLSVAYGSQSNIATKACDTCKKIVTTVKTYVDDEEPVIQKKLDQICQEVPSQYRNYCTQIADDYLPKLKQLVDQYSDPTEICVKILHICPAAQFQRLFSFDDVKHKMSKFGGEMKKDFGIVKRKLKEAALDLKKQFGDKMAPLHGLTCPICMSMVGNAVDKFHGKRDSANDNVDKMCEKVPHFAKSICHEMVGTYMPLIEDALENKVDSHQICGHHLTLCDMPDVLAVGEPHEYNDYAEADVDRLAGGNDYAYGYPDPDEYDYDRLDVVDDIKALIPRGMSSLCDTCKKVVTTVKTYVDDEEPIIQKKLDQVCQKVPSQYRTYCTMVADTYLPELKTLVDQYADPTEICVDILHVCPSNPRFSRHFSFDDLAHQMKDIKARMSERIDQASQRMKEILTSDNMKEAFSKLGSKIVEMAQNGSERTKQVLSETSEKLKDLQGKLGELGESVDNSELMGSIRQLASDTLQKLRDSGLYENLQTEIENIKEKLSNLSME